jgi:phenylacetate-CoA ligase
MYPELSESERFPMLTQRGRELLYRMRQHPNAPIWNWPNGEQLDQVGLERVRAFAHSLQTQPKLDSLDPPPWLEFYVDRCLSKVPYYRQRSKLGTPFLELPTCRRADLAPQVWQFVPDTEPIDQVIVFSSSGTTGYPTRTPHHPYSAACGVPLMEYALRTLCGIELSQGPEHVAITNVAAYSGAFTTAIVVGYLAEAGCVRVNLDESAWRCVDDRTRFINHWKAPIWLGDPVAFAALESIELDHTPAAILASIMHLSDAYSAHLASRYGCPVLDMYAMTEAGIIAVSTEHGHRILAHDLYVEVLDEADQHCLPGVRGEITLTGGRNPFLPLLRYRTGDFASIELREGNRVLIGLEGRQRTEYQTANGRIVHSMEITRLMRRYPVVRYQMTQNRDGSFQLEYEGHIDTVVLSRELEELFMETVKLTGMLKST